MNLHHLAVFTQVVLDGGFTAAARSLQLQKSAVSAAVSRLEADLGVRLLNRTSRTVSVTEEGAALFSHASPALEALRESGQAVAEMRGALKGRIRITAPAGLGSHILEPVIAGFLVAHPETSIEAVFTMRKVDLVGEGFDLAIRAGDVENEDLIARFIGREEAGLYASPAFLERKGPLLTLDDIHRIDFVILSYRQGGQGDAITLSGPNGMETATVRPRMISDHYSIALKAVSDAVGVGLLPDILCREHVENGQLVRILPSYSLPGRNIHLVYPMNRYIPRRVIALRDAIVSQHV